MVFGRRAKTGSRDLWACSINPPRPQESGILGLIHAEGGGPLAVLPPSLTPLFHPTHQRNKMGCVTVLRR